MKWGEFFRSGGAMGFTPKQIREMSLWEFMMTVDGFKIANGGDKKEEGEVKPPTDDEFDALLASMNG